MKKGWKIGIGVVAASVIVIVLGVIIAVAGKSDQRNEALKAIQNFFTGSLLQVFSKRVHSFGWVALIKLIRVST